MAKMKTLTINGQKFTVDDPDAVQSVNADDTIPEAGAVPVADGNGGATWEKLSTAFIIQTVEELSTATKYKTYSLDCKYADIEAAYNAGMPMMFRHSFYEGETEDIPFLATNGAMYVFEAESNDQRLRVIITPETSGLFEGVDVIAQVYEATSTAELPSGATEGQVLTADADGNPVWADASGGGGVFVVKLAYDDSGTLTADKTIDDIIEAYNAGYLIRAVGDLWGVGIYFHLPLATVSETGKMAVFSLTSVVVRDSTSVMAGNYTENDQVIITESGVSYETLGTGIGLPFGGTAGQVLTIGDDGSPVWADPVATSAEGVLFG